MTERELKPFLQEPYSDANSRKLINWLFSDSVTLFASANILIEATEVVRQVRQIGTVSLSDGRTFVILPGIETIG